MSPRDRTRCCNAPCATYWITSVRPVYDTRLSTAHNKLHDLEFRDASSLCYLLGCIPWCIIYICVYIYIYIYIHVYTYIHIYVYIYIYTYTYISLSLSMCIILYIYIYTHYFCVLALVQLHYCAYMRARRAQRVLAHPWRLQYWRSVARKIPQTVDIIYNTILYYTILYYSILYYTILYYTILYYTIIRCSIL